MKRVAILGSTGSIGRQALSVIEAYPDRLSAAVLTAGSNADLLIRQARRFRPAMVAIADPGLAGLLQDGLAGTGIKIASGPEGLREAAAADGVDLALVALVGAAGIAPTLAAIAAGKDIALANKETLVAAGALVTSMAKAAGVRLLPVDSEHSAILQCLAGVRRETVRRIILTASGGPFRAWPLADLERVSVEQALRHPNWRMGEKITIDSATLVNKGLEVIEAHWFFGLDYEEIDVIIHPESIIHSLVEMIDGAVLAQLGTPDMRLPIAYALHGQDRLPAAWPGLSSLAGLDLHFSAVDQERFPALRLAYDVGRRGGTLPAVFSAANEIAVYGFPQGRIGFTEIVRAVAAVCEEHQPFGGPCPDLEAVMAADAWARAAVERWIAAKAKQR